MQRIYPVSYDTCRSLIGKPVVLFLRDGGEFVGTLTSVENNQLVFDPQGGVSGTKQKAKVKKQKVLTKKKGSKEAIAEDPEQEMHHDPFYEGPLGRPEHEMHGGFEEQPFGARRFAFDLDYVGAVFLIG